MVNAGLLHSMLESAVDLRRIQSYVPDARIGSDRAHVAPKLDVDALLAQQVSEAFEEVSTHDAAFLLRFIEDVLDFPRTFAVVQAALERAQHAASEKSAVLA